MERTLVWDEFVYVFEGQRRRIKPVRTYRNPIFLAREWAEAMKKGGFRSQSAFAKAIGVSPARVSQLLGLLLLCPEVLEVIASLGDPLYSKKVTERKLRVILKLSEVEQRKRVEALLPD